MPEGSPLSLSRSYKAILGAARSGSFLSYGDIAAANDAPWQKVRRLVPNHLGSLVVLAHERGWPRLDLSVLDWNPARGFYERHGMSHQQEWLPYRMEADTIARLAAEAPAIER